LTQDRVALAKIRYLFMDQLKVAFFEQVERTPRPRSPRPGTLRSKLGTGAVG
jgi:hypothetical protein